MNFFLIVQCVAEVIIAVFGACVLIVSVRDLLKQKGRNRRFRVLAKEKGFCPSCLRSFVKDHDNCEYCAEGVYRDVLGTPCRYNFCPMCGKALRQEAEKPEPYKCPHGHADELDCPVCGH